MADIAVIERALRRPLSAVEALALLRREPERWHITHWGFGCLYAGGLEDGDDAWNVAIYDGRLEPETPGTPLTATRPFDIKGEVRGLSVHILSTRDATWTTERHIDHGQIVVTHARTGDSLCYFPLRSPVERGNTLTLHAGPLLTITT